jgi:Flp pilus assembly protein TadD
MCASLALASCQGFAPNLTLLRSSDTSVQASLLPSNEPFRLGRLHLEAGNYGAAERQFRDAVETNKEDALSWIGLAAAYDNLGRFDLAERAYDQARRLRGDSLEIVNNLGYSYLLRGDGPRALAQFRRALALDPGNSTILNNIRLLQLGQRPARATPL